MKNMKDMKTKISELSNCVIECVIEVHRKPGISNKLQHLVIEAVPEKFCSPILHDLHVLHGENIRTIYRTGAKKPHPVNKALLNWVWSS